MTSTAIDELLSGPLVTWFASCLEDPNVLSTYEDLVDGILLHNVFLQVNPEPLRDEVVPSCGNPAIRSKNLQIIVENIKQFYEEELGHILLRLPDTINLGKEPELHINDMKLLLLLLLGCAVQCPNKEKFITKITSFPVDNQLAIVECIKQVTDNHDIVITQESMETVNMGFLFMQIKAMIQELNLYKEKWGNVAANEISKRNNSSIGAKVEEINKVHQSNPVTRSEREDNHHYAVELADWKSKVRKQRQELEEKTEALIECKEELEHTKALLVKFRQENQELMHEARTAKTYRDELDAVIERAERADHLEVEVKNYRDKISDFDYFKIRVDELQEDNKVLLETREMLEGQVDKLQKRSDKVLQLETEIIKYKQALNDMALERAADNEKYQELLEENIQLQKLTKAAANEAALAGSMSDSEEPAHTDNRLSDQLTNNAQARALKLELENRRLISIIESLKEDSFHETSSHVLELEKEKKKLTLKVDSLNDKSERLKQQNSDLELVCKQALEENRKLQNTIKNQRASVEKQQQDLQTQHGKMVELEKQCDIAVKEKQRVQSLLESVQRRADDLERTLETTNQKVEELKDIELKMNEIKSKCTFLESKITILEKEKDIAQRDTFRFKETIEEKDVALDKATNTIEVLERKVAQLEQEVQNSLSQILRLQEVERSSKELDSRAAIDRETLETLKSNLVAEKLNTQQMYTVLEKLGLSDTMLSLPLDNILERIAQNSEVVNLVKKSIKSEPSRYGLIIESESKKTDENSQSDLNNALQKTVESLKNEQEQLQSNGILGNMCNMRTFLLSLFLVSGVLVDGSFPVKKLAKRGLYHPQQHGSTYAGGFTSVVHGHNGHNYGGSDHGFDFGQGQGQGHGGYVHGGGIVFGGHSNGLSLNQGNSYGHGYGYGYGNSVPHNVVNHVVKVPVPVAEPVPVIRNVPVSVPHYVPVEVRRPVKVPVPHPVPVIVEKPYHVSVDRPVPVYVPSPVKVPHPVPQPYPVPPPVNPHQEHSHHFTLPLPSKPISTIPGNSYIPINQPAHVGGTSLEHSGLDLSFQHGSKLATSYGAPSVSHELQNTEFLGDGHSSNSFGGSSSSQNNDGYSYPIPSTKFSH